MADERSPAKDDPEPDEAPTEVTGSPAEEPTQVHDRAPGDGADAAADVPEREVAGTGRRIGSWIVLAIVTLLVLLGSFAVWANRQLLNTDNWTQTSALLIENPKVQTQLSDYLTNQLYDNVDVQGELQKLLPPVVAPLAGPAAGALRGLVTDVADKALSDPAVQNIWVQANRIAHQRFVDLAENKGSLTVQGDNVVLNLKPIATQIAQRVGIPQSLVNKLPPDAAQLTVMKADGVKSVQKGAAALEGLAWLLPLLGVLGYILFVWLAQGRRRQAIRAVGLSLILVGLLLFIAKSVVGNSVVNDLSGSESVKPAVEATWEIATRLLVQIAGALIFVGVPFVIAAWLAGPTKAATGLRRWMSPVLDERPEVGYGVVIALLLLLFLWGPFPATRNPIWMIVFVALAVGGMYVLRKQTQEEFPASEREPRKDLSTRAAGVSAAARDKVSSVKDQASAMSASRKGESGGAATATGGDRMADLERLVALRDGGALDDQEFAAEKARILGGG